jgi:hypothetical protein
MEGVAAFAISFLYEKKEITNLPLSSVDEGCLLG